VQIDGLAWRALLEAIRRRRAPFLGRLVRRHRGRALHRFSHLRPGVPATTPKVQAELLYGEEQRFPGFRYLRRSTGETVYFGNAFDVARIEANDFAGHFGILQNSGSSYFNIFDGSADLARFSTSGVGAGTIWATPKKRLRQGPYLLWMWLRTLPRVTWRTLREIALEVFDVVRAFVRHEPNRGHFSFVIRSMANILQGEITVAAMREDIKAGTRHLFINFIGYDKAAHLRGPLHPFAFWSLKLIDRDLRRLYRMAMKSTACRYDFFVMSDHGMVPSRPIAIDAGMEFEELMNQELAARGYEGPPLLLRATGNLAHLYLSSDEHLDHDAVVARVPALEGVLSRSKYVGWWVSRAGDRLRIVRDGAVHFVQSSDAPTPRLDADLVRDLWKLLALEDSGDVVIFGAREPEFAWNFLDEYGCHGGDEPEEQDAFVVHPDGFNPEGRRLAPLDLFRFFRDEYHGGGEAQSSKGATPPPPA